MQCSEFRQAAGADPQHLNAEAQAHRAQCHACMAYAQQMLQLDALLKRAMEIPVPEGSTELPVVAPRTAGRWLALAASVLVAVVVGLGAWLAAPRETLAADVVAHVRDEAEIMVVTDKRVDEGKLDEALHRAGVRLRSGEDKVSVARTCMFHGHLVPHLIVQTAGGPVTVLVLSREKVSASQTFEDQGYRGTIVPSGPGSIAIVASTDAAVREAGATFASQVEWLPQEK
jgi:hypothetical protein